MADEQVRFRAFRRRATWRWCLAGAGAAFILLGIAMGVPDSAAGTGPAQRSATARTVSRHTTRRPHGASRHHAPAPITSNPATGLGGPLPVGSSDGTSLASAQPVATTLPPVQALGVGVTPAAQTVPMTTTAAVLALGIGLSAFAAGWTIGQRRALAPA